MLSSRPYCLPEPGTTCHVYVRGTEAKVTLYLRSVCSIPGLLQCWSNLPRAEADDKQLWHSIDVGSCHGTNVSLVKAIEVDVRLLQKAARNGDDLKYSLTWRVRSIDENGQTMSQWLYSPGHDSVIFFHLPQKERLDDLIKDMHIIHDADIHKEEDLAVFSIHLDSKYASGQDFPLISPSRAITDGAVWERTKATWHTSRSIQDIHEISNQFAASLIVLNFDQSGLSVVILPLCTETATVAILQRGGNLYATVYQFGTPEVAEDRAKIVIGPTHELHSLIRRCMPTCLPPLSDISLQTPLIGSSGLGFCSWEALGAGKLRPTLINLTKLLDRFQGRAPGSITNLLIDDGWQHVSLDGSRKLLGFDLDPSLMEEEQVILATDETLLKHYIRKLSIRYSQIQNYGVWCTLGGYWSGLDPSNLSQHYGPLIEAKIQTSSWLHNRDQTWWLPAVDKLESFYNDYFSLLHQSGISFVKVDDQADWEWIQSLTSLHPITAPAYYDLAWKTMTAMASKYFGPSSVINSMAFGHRFITHQATFFGNLHVMRNSDDTFPDVSESHAWHLYHNILNACFSSLNSRILPDADMITSHLSSDSSKVDWADYHAAFRACFSTSTIWISDSIEKSDKGNDKVLDKLLAPAKTTLTKTSLGQSKTVQVTSSRTDEVKVALPLPGSVFLNHTGDHSGPALKMSVEWNSVNGIGVLLSMWNTRCSFTSYDWLSCTDIAQTLQQQQQQQGKTPVIRLFLFSAELQIALLFRWTSHNTIENQHKSLMASKPILPITLHPAQYAIFSLVSAFPIKPDDSSHYIACVGLIDKYAGLFAVMDVFQNNDSLLSASISRAGKCGFLIQGKTLADLRNWSAKVDEIEVQQNHVETITMQDCHLLVVDMVKHLKSICLFDRRTDSWHVNLVKTI